MLGNSFLLHIEVFLPSYTTYLSSLVDKCFNRQTAFKWILIVLHYSRRFVSTRAWGRFPSGASQEKKRQLALTFNYRYIDDILSLNNTRFGQYLHLIYLIDFEVKATTPRQMWWFRLSSSLFSIICNMLHQRMAFSFQYSCVILGIVPSAKICWRKSKSYLYKDTFFLDVIHRFKNPWTP